MGGKDFSPLRNVRIGIRDVICIWIGKLVGLGVCGHEDVLMDRGYDRALADSYYGISGG